MLRALRRSFALTPAVPRSCLSSSAPSETTTVMLRKLHPSATAKGLDDLVKASGLRIRKAEIEPGCAVQVLNEVHAECAASLIAKKFNCETKLSGTTVPALLLQNLPGSLGAEDIKKSFVKHDPKSIHISGGVTLSFTVSNNLEAIALSKAVQDVALEGRNLHSHLYRLPNGSYNVQVTNVHPNVSADAARRAVEAAVSAHAQGVKVTATPRQGSHITLRIGGSEVVDPKVVIDKLATLSSGTQTFQVTPSKPLKLPAIFVRNVSKIGIADVEKVFTEYEHDRIQFTYRSKDIPGDLAVVYFKTVSSALNCLRQIKNLRVNGKRLSPSFRETAEPAILLSDVSIKKDEDIDGILKFFGSLSPVYHEVRGTSEVVVVFRDNKDVETALMLAKRLKVNDKAVTAQANPIHDQGFEIQMDASSTTVPSADAIKAALAEINVNIKDVTAQSNLSAFVTFDTLHRATLAQHCVEDGSVAIGQDSSASAAVGGALTSMLSVYPSHAVVVEGLDGNVPASSVSDFLKEHGLKPMSIDRNAIVKFKRHAEVVPGMKKLKTLQLGGLQLAPERYRRLEQSIKDESYDIYGEDEVFDGESLRQTMKDYMHMDPSTRFQIARNSFERAVAGAKATNDESFLFDENAPPAVQKEIKDLMASPTPDTDRLFELFLQREDMLRFSHDFRELTALVGNPADATDSFNWHNFSIDTEEELVRLRDAMIASQEDALTGKPKAPSRKARLQKLIEDIENKKVSSEEQHFAAVDEALRKEAAATSTGDEDDDDADDIKISQSEEASLKDDRVGQDIEELADEESSPENIISVTDRNGYVWSGLVINTDTTQTTLPSGRLLSHRALVMVGNLKGAGGFGMGKGENAQVALKRAFRDAVKNIVFIDLYDNFGLAHDLYGRHNACHVYIKATPRERPFVGSPLARQILNRFGISTASVRIVGRRDPYAVCRAITYALQKHQNLDEFARDRGLRYLTLRWIYDNKI